MDQENSPYRAMMISDHAFMRFLEHKKKITRLQNDILNIVLQGQPVKPVDRHLIHYLNHKCADAEYFLGKGLIAVVVEKRIVTVYPYKPKKWALIKNTR